MAITEQVDFLNKRVQVDFFSKRVQELEIEIGQLKWRIIALETATRNATNQPGNFLPPPVGAECRNGASYWRNVGFREGVTQFAAELKRRAVEAGLPLEKEIEEMAQTVLNPPPRQALVSSV